MPNFILDCEYESLVENKESEIKKILKFCGLPWDEKCLNPDKNSKTPIIIDIIIGLNKRFLTNTDTRIFFLVVSSKKKVITDNKIIPSINIILVTWVIISVPK